MSVLQGQDHIGISELIDRLRLPRKLSRIGIDRSILIQGFSNSLAKGIAKNRYTVLNEITNPNKVINDIYHTLNKNQIILDWELHWLIIPNIVLLIQMSKSWK